jgi:hypothetical protein
VIYENIPPCPPGRGSGAFTENLTTQQHSVEHRPGLIR